MSNRYRKIPQVNDILIYFDKKNYDLPREYIKEVSNYVITSYREKLKTNPNFEIESEDIYLQIEKMLNSKSIYSLEQTINATGVVLHTNLGRAPLSKRAIDRIVVISSSYSNLEYNLDTGKRGSRYEHVIDLVKKLTGAEDALIVNNNAAAVFLMLNTLSKGKETIISRGELVEIGDSFRISEIMENSGAILVEVGATNRTHLYDYENKINDETKVLMKVHTSNYKIMGFHEDVSASELSDLISGKDIHIIEDLGSGSLIDLSRYGLSYERTVRDCINDGIDLVSFSCDKLLGGPQGGIICGNKELIQQIKNNQLLRAFRVCKLTLCALEATLIEYLDEKKVMEEIPTLKMISMNLEEIDAKAINFSNKLKNSIKNIEFEIIDSDSLVGGGAYPTEVLKSRAIAINPKTNADELEEFLRLSKYHIISNVENERILLDVRTILEDEFEKIIEILKEYYEN